MVASIDPSLVIFGINILTALKSSLKHRPKHVLRLLRLYGNQTLQSTAIKVIAMATLLLRVVNQ